MTRRNGLLWGWVLLLGLPLAGCGGGSGVAAPSKPLRSYFPAFAVGDRWTWRVAEGGATRTETDQVGGTETRGTGTAYRLETRNVAGVTVGAQILSLNDNRLLQHGMDLYDDDGAPEGSVRYPAPWGVDLSSLPGQESDQTFQHDASAGGVTSTTTYRMRVRHAGYERIVVPAGTFTAAKMVVRTTVTVTVGGVSGPSEEGTHTEWRVEGIGPIQSIDGDGAVRTLTGASVGGTTVP